MRPRQWMQIAAVASAMGLAGAAIANDMDRTPGADSSSAATMLDNDATSAQGTNPAADLDSSADVNGGAGLRDNASGNASSPTDPNRMAAPGMNRGGDLDNSADVNGDAATRNDNATSNDSSMPDSVAPPRTGSDVQPGDMGPGNTRGE